MNIKSIKYYALGNNSMVIIVAIAESDCLS